MIWLWFACNADPTWTRHTIDDGAAGADGVRLADVDGDGRADVVSPFEEGGVVRIALRPADPSERWTVREAGRVADPEDALPMDVDGDGVLDVVVAAEGDTATLVVLRGTGDGFEARPVPASAGTEWLQLLPMAIAGPRDVVAGGRGTLGWFDGAWTWHPLRTSGWIMSLLARDMDGDGDDDVLFSDRRGPSGIAWLERPADPLGAWPEHPVAATGREVMFVATGDLDGGGDDLVAAVRPRSLLLVRHDGRVGEVVLPDTLGTAKAVAIGDVDGDGRPDLVVTTEDARWRVGVAWLSATGDPFADRWVTHPIARDGRKYDTVLVDDLDGDGDLDVLTSEEGARLGVIWYENPARRLTP